MPVVARIADVSITAIPNFRNVSELAPVLEKRMTTC